jgi:chlorophyllase
MGTETTGDTGPSEDTGGQPDGGEADASDDPDMAGQDTGADTGNSGELYVGSGDAYAPGALEVTRVEVEQSDQGPPRDVIVVAPDMSGLFAVVVLQHGFTLPNTVYETLMEHLASHGFIVVAPQMYSPNSFQDVPETADEAEAATMVWDWIGSGLDAELTATPAPTQLGLAGHSRGAKVIWLAMESGYARAKALAGIDPVDGTGGPLGSEARVLEGGLDSDEPAFILGTGLGPELVFGMACAPEGDNHENFYEALPSPAYHVVAPDYGHEDMLDDDLGECSFCGLCEEGPDDGGLRELTAGMLTAFFRMTLQGVDDDEALLTDTASAPITIEAETK